VWDPFPHHTALSTDSLLSHTYNQSIHPSIIQTTTWTSCLIHTVTKYFKIPNRLPGKPIRKHNNSGHTQNMQGTRPSRARIHSYHSRTHTIQLDRLAHTYTLQLTSASRGMTFGNKTSFSLNETVHACMWRQRGCMPRAS
jgi:hypothetical protein